MSNIKLLDEKFTRVALGSVLPQKSMIEEYQTRHIKLKISSNLGYRAFDEFSNCRVLKDGSIEVDTDVLEGEWLIDTLLSYGSDLKVIEPPELKEELTNKIEAMLRIYLKRSK